MMLVLVPREGCLVRGLVSTKRDSPPPDAGPCRGAGCPVSCVATSVASAAAPGTGRDPTQHIHLSGGGGDGKVKDM